MPLLGRRGLRAWIGDDYFQTVVEVEFERDVRDISPVADLPKIKKISLYGAGSRRS